MLEASHISLRYGKHLALDDVSIAVNAGECVAILGANGAGKSSLLRALTAMAPITGPGAVRFRGRDLARLPKHRIVEEWIAHVPEGRGLFTDMTVNENLWLGSNPLRARTGIETRRADLLRLFPRLAERRNQRVGTMSGGEQQMVAIARALMSRPEILLLDEPSLGLAPIVVQELFQILKGVRDTGTAILIVEQNVRASLALAHRAYLMEAGRMIGEGRSDVLREDPLVGRAFFGH